LITNEQQDMSVREDINQVNGTMQQTTVIDINDDLSTDDDNLLTCALCLKKKTLTEIEDMLIQRDNPDAYVTIIAIV
jgi:hypothetical protein